MQRLSAGVLVFLALFQEPTEAQEKSFTVTLQINKAITAPTPVCMPLTLPAEMATWDMVFAPAGKGNVWGQLTAPGLFTEHIKATREKGVRRDLHLVLTEKDNLAAGAAITLEFKLLRLPDIYIPQFNWKDAKGQHADLMFGKAPVLRYMYKAYDDSSAAVRNQTYKVFHHLFDPAGKRLVTNGGHTSAGVTDPKKLLYPHHRGIQMGFSKTFYAGGKKKADTWHCQKDDHQSHQGFLKIEANYLLGRHRVAVDWHGAGKEVIVKEERELTVYKVPGGTLVEFASRLKAARGTVKLDGDPQHAGFQFRAHNDVAAKTAKQTYYLRPDGKGELGATRNWPADKTMVHLPWYAMSFVLDGKRYTVCYLDHPNNPRDSRHSERDYGRFGCYFEREITADRPLVLTYRLWLQEGEMTVEQVQALSAAFTAPPKVTVK